MRLGRLEKLIAGLMTRHYDPAYRCGSQTASRALTRIGVNTISDVDLREAARRVAQTVHGDESPNDHDLIETR